jgi:hypothetical protein
MELRFSIELLPEDTALGADSPRADIYMYALHGRQVDQQALIDGGVSRHVVAAATNGDLEAGRPCERDRIDEVGNAATAGDQGRVSVDEAVVDPADVIVVRVRGSEQSPRERMRGVIDGFNKY